MAVKVHELRTDRLSLVELNDLKARVEAAIVQQKKKARDELLTRINMMADDAGFKLREIFGGPVAGVAKYVNPENPKETWTGKGRAPNWLAAKLARGAKREDFEIL